MYFASVSIFQEYSLPFQRYPGRARAMLRDRMTGDISLRRDTIKEVPGFQSIRFNLNQ